MLHISLELPLHCREVSILPESARVRINLFTRTKKPPEWVTKVVIVFEKARERIDTQSAPHKTSDEVLELLRPDLEAIGFKVESGKRQSDKLHRPVLFGEMGIPRVKYEID